jgi:predicted enzyme related to lactoylglutathione lyase
MKISNLVRLKHIILVTLLITSSILAADLLPPLNDPPSDQSLPGKFSWFDLASPDLKGQREFYASVFGWNFQVPRGVGDYVLVLNNGKAIAGMFSYEPPEGEQDGSVWISLMSVPDVDQAVKVAKANGGSVEIAAVDVARRGRHALLKDPANALFGVLQSSSGTPPDEEVPIGGFFWVDLFARDPEKMSQFYLKLAPYELEHRTITDELTHTLLVAHDLPRAGIVPVDEEANRSAWVPYVRVADVQATLEKVVDGGGFAVIAPDPAILDSKLAVFVDPNGAYTGIVEWDYDEGYTP